MPGRLTFCLSARPTSMALVAEQAEHRERVRSTPQTWCIRL